MIGVRNHKIMEEKERGCYFNFHSNHPPHVKRGIIRSLHNRANIVYREGQDLAHEVNKLNMTSNLMVSPLISSIQSSIIPEGKTG
jgi:hypothetical protein